MAEILVFFIGTTESSGSFSINDATYQAPYYIYNCHLGWKPTKLMIVTYRTGYRAHNVFIDTINNIHYEVVPEYGSTTLTDDGFQYKYRADSLGSGWAVYYLAVQD